MRCDRYKDDYGYQVQQERPLDNKLQERQRVPAPTIHNTRAKKEKSKAPIIILIILLFLAGASYGGYYYYIHYMQPIKVDIWNLIEEPSFSGTEGEGVANPVTLDKKKLNKFLKNIESTYTSDRAEEIKAIINKMTFEVTPNTKLSNKTEIQVTCKYDYKGADNGRYNFNMKDGKNSSPLTKKFEVSGLKKQATEAEILNSFKDRANGTITGASFEHLYRVTKGDEKRYAAVLSVKSNGKLTYRCLLTEPVTTSNALSVAFSEFGSATSDYNQFLNSLKEKGYTSIEV